MHSHTILSRTWLFGSIAGACLTSLLAFGADAQAPKRTASAFPVLARFAGDSSASQLFVAPNGQLIGMVVGKEFRVQHVASKRIWKIADSQLDDVVWSPKSDRLVWSRVGDKKSEEFLWSIAINPATGAPIGSAQRISVGPGSSASISLDGKWVAYQSGDRSDVKTPLRLVVMPIEGGPEREIALFGGLEEMHWSRDGQSLYLMAGDRGAHWKLTKAFVDGRPAVLIPQPVNSWFAGMTADRTRLIFVAAKSRVAEGDQATIVDTLGREVGRVPLPVDAGTQYDGIIGDSLLVWQSSSERRQLVIQPIAGGPARSLPIVGDANLYPQWSPDGRRIAFHVAEGDRQSLAVMNADGSNVRVYRQTDLRRDPWGYHWSPDSRLIAYLEKNSRKLMLLDAARGTIRGLFADSTVHVGQWVWHNDSRAISAVLKSEGVPLTIALLPLIGPQRTQLTQLTLDKLPGGGLGFQFIDGASVVTRSDSGVFLVPLDGGAPRKLTDVPRSTQPANAAISADHKTIAVPFRDVSRGMFGWVEFIATESGARREISLPFWFLGPNTPTFSADGRTIFIAGRSPNDPSGSNVYAVPVDGALPRIVANLGGMMGGASFALSPDGRFIVYAAQRDVSRSLLLVDLRKSSSSAPAPRQRR